VLYIAAVFILYQAVPPPDSNDEHIMKDKSLLFAALLLFTVFPSGESRSQLNPFETFFNEFNGVALWASFGASHSNISTRKTDIPFFNHSPVRYGFELLLGPYPSPSPPPEIDELDRILDTLDAHLAVLYGMGDTADTAVIQKLLQEQKKLLIKKEYIETRDRKRSPDVTVDLGIGFEYTDSFRPQVGQSSMQLPVTGMYISAYISRDLKSWEQSSFGVYIGGTIGQYQLYNAALLSADGLYRYDVTSSTYAIEPVLGAYLFYDAGSLSPFLELSYKYLAFDGLRYYSIDAAPVLTTAPGRLDLSGVFITIGLQMAKKGR
jgi:hypothetical protein